MHAEISLSVSLKLRFLHDTAKASSAALLNRLSAVPLLNQVYGVADVTDV
jgi:hypothetical protein